MSQASMNKLADFCDSLIDRIPLASNKLKCDAVLAITDGLTQTTPIDTGAAISNWIVTEGEPSTDIIEPYAPSVQGSHSHATHGDISGAPFNAAGAMDVARAIVAVARPGDVLYIANNDPAIEATDGRGTSKQVAPGYVDRAIIASVDVMSRAKLDP